MKHKLRRLKKSIATRTLNSRGVSIFFDAHRLLPEWQVNTVFDVGANIGQSAIEFRKAFPAATIYCFEPVQKTFEKLKSNTGNLKQTKNFLIALSASDGEGRITVNEQSTQNRITSVMDCSTTEQVKIRAIDSFAAENNIDHINYLKVDTEGNDLNVLLGATNMLTNQRVDLIEVECGMNKNNTYHNYFIEILDFLSQKGYRLFGIYEQKHEWKESKPSLRRANLAFISDRLNSSTKSDNLI
ncbi:hypothetical protein Maes01_01734 [Microbulbifer aestuariivivens]|uniref:Methyltransferase FkbM domain-containing protein n=1 Tax=Microbulbifer aestuariivivens TaxID=1908308 RepID=A0ABP9WPP3_9GAMM